MQPINCQGCEHGIVSLVGELGDNEALSLQFLRRHGVIRTFLNCEKCGAPCREIEGQLLFRCQKTRFINGLSIKCNFSRTIKINSWLINSRLKLNQVCRFVCLWLTTPYPRQQHLMNELKMSSDTIVDWSTFCREICLDSIILTEDDVIGGEGIEVEIDEAKVGKRKYNRGRIIEGTWIFGAFERGTKRCFFESVENRTAQTLMEIILRRIAPGSIIISDEWRSYVGLGNYPQYQHLTVNHSQNFVDPDSGAHTQNIERTWRSMRAAIPRFGRREEHIAGYLAEFWKRRIPVAARLHHFLMEVSRQFPPGDLQLKAWTCSLRMVHPAEFGDVSISMFLKYGILSIFCGWAPLEGSTKFSCDNGIDGIFEMIISSLLVRKDGSFQKRF